MRNLNYLAGRFSDEAKTRRERKWFRVHGNPDNPDHVNHEYPSTQNGVCVPTENIKKTVVERSDSLLAQ